MRVLYCHGLESGPGGFKVNQMRSQGLDVIVESMEMSLWDVRARNSLARKLLSPAALFGRWPWHWLPGAMDDSFAACVGVQRDALLRAPTPPQVLVGSSWGGAVAAALLADGSWAGPAVLLCPALRTKERWAGASRAPSSSADAIIAKLAALPDEQKARCLLVHGTADATVPVDDSVSLSSATGIPLELIEGGSHGLGAIVKDGRLVRFVQRVGRGG